MEIRNGSYLNDSISPNESMWEPLFACFFFKTPPLPPHSLIGSLCVNWLRLLCFHWLVVTHQWLCLCVYSRQDHVHVPFLLFALSCPTQIPYISVHLSRIHLTLPGNIIKVLHISTLSKRDVVFRQHTSAAPFIFIMADWLSSKQSSSM